MIRICKKCKVELGYGEKVYCVNCEDKFGEGAKK